MKIIDYMKSIEADLKCDYTIKFKATKRLFNLFNVRLTYTYNVDAEPIHDGVDMDTESVKEMQLVVEEVAKIKNLTNAKLISYTRYA